VARALRREADAFLRLLWSLLCVFEISSEIHIYAKEGRVVKLGEGPSDFRSASKIPNCTSHYTKKNRERFTCPPPP